jgi:hypothetical protein
VATETLTANCPSDPAENVGDGNDSPQTADPYSVSAQQFLCSPTDEDWFKFDVQANVTYRLDTYLVSANNDPELTLFSDQNQTLIQFNDDSENSGTFESGGYRAGITFAPAAAGTYYARVRPSPAAIGVGGTSFSYYMRLTSSNLNHCTVNEPDDNALNGQAKDFVVGTFQARALCALGDQDWVRFKIIKPNTTLRIETFNMGSGQSSNGAWQGTDTVLELFGRLSDPMLTFNDDFPTGTAARRSMIEHTFTNPGTYFVKVRPFSSGGAGETYNLRITRMDNVLLNTPAN